ncbi:hypothetical protein D9756_004398 [Leucocoprinus leucothites]|uniref:Rgp1-domain-containing protein n=1 Tax=Leucocoprinus leucothites TaxID=201217 RepID=A0A8H5FZS3_9AGAR|nr:hypothetical protein D9756_004398 [Leucoagaricus leucothites]
MPGVAGTQFDHESPVRVVITPSQSSFFAGEQFSVTITFTNTRTSEAGPSKHHLEQAYPQTRTHKRGAHSISSAPLARPPTSPGTPRTLLNPSPRKERACRDDEDGLSGWSTAAIDRAEEEETACQIPLSVNITPRTGGTARRRIIAATPASAPFNQQVFSDARKSPVSPHIPSPLSRTDTLALSSNHPHARKQSVFDGQLSLDILSPTTSMPPQPYTPTTSTNSSLSLSTISETSSQQPSASSLTSPSTPRISSPLSPSYSQPAFQPNTANSNAVQAYPSITPTTATSPPRATPRGHERRFSQQIHLGLGQPSTDSRNRAQAPRRDVYSSTFPQSSSELVLYSYAQLVGTVLVIPEDSGVATPTQDQTHRMNKIRRALLRKRVAVGGGSMDISQSLYSGSSLGQNLSGSNSHYTNHQPISGGYPRRKGHGRSVSFSASLMSLLSPAPGPTSEAMGERATTSSNHLNGSATASVTGHKPINGPGPGGGTGLGLGIVDSHSLGGEIVEDIDPELPLPTFEAQPSMLAVDLSLSPGESRSYTYTIKLPDILPPTYKGRSLRFSYELVVGTCRAAPSMPTNLSSGGAGTSSISRVMKVPIRVYNHVTVDRPVRPYDILWPVSRNRLSGLGKGKEREIPETQGKVIEAAGAVVKRAAHLTPPKSGFQGSFEDLRQYTKRLVSSLPPVANGDGTGTPRSPSSVTEERSEASSSTSSLPSVVNGASKNAGLRMSVDNAREQEEEEDRAMIGCREAVEILTRLPKKASYDVNKDGVKVAVLTFSKSAYRLGETVTGIVELNDRTGRARVLQLCVILETHETLPTSVAPAQSARNLKRTYAEHYASFTLNTLRTTFALDIPSDASPAFQINMNDVEGYSQIHSASTPASQGGLEWKVRLCLLVAIASEESDLGTEGVRFRSLERDGPRGEWECSWRAPMSLAPLEKPRVGLHHLKNGEEESRSKSWTQLFYDSVWSTIGGTITLSALGEADDQNQYQHGENENDEVESGIEGDERSYDGIKPDLAGGVGVGVDFANDGGGEEGQGQGQGQVQWKEVKLETVECEVPIKVWPGNTAFRAVDVIFDV